MAGNSFGTIFRLTTFGESHGDAIGGVVDGCPAGFDLNLNAIQAELDRRRPGQSHISTQRKESDTVRILSGVFEGKTTGAPIGFIIPNEDQRSKDYSHLKDSYRPSHADYSWEQKFGTRDYRGGGRSSARETACRVVAGAIASQLLSHYGIHINAWVSGVGDLDMAVDTSDVDISLIDSNLVRCPDPETAETFLKAIETARKEGDSLGGRITCKATGVPAGLGAPVFDKLHADLGKAMLGINAVKGFEIGSGFAGSRMKGSEHNDVFSSTEKGIRTATNRSGGIQGGISNGEDIFMRIAFKPVATIMQKQQSVDREGNQVVLEGKGRHDPCVVPRAVPIVEAMCAIVLLDHLLLQRTSQL